MAVSEAGISTVGVELWYHLSTTGASYSNTATDWTQLERVNSIGGVTMDSEAIDASALEDFSTRYIKGRQDLGGGQWTISFNLTTEVRKQLEDCISAYEGKTTAGKMYFQVYMDGLDTATDPTAFFVVAEPPKFLPMAEQGQNQLSVIELTFTLNEYIGYKAPVHA